MIRAAAQRWFVWLGLLLACSGCGDRRPAPPPQGAVNLLGDLDSVDLLWDTHSIDPGSPAFEASLLQGWSDRKNLDGGATVAVAGPRSELAFNVLSAGELKIVIRCRTAPECSASQLLIPYVNGVRIRAARAGADFQDLTFPVPAPAVRTGINRLRINLSAPKPGLEVDEVTFTGSGTPEGEFEQIRRDSSGGVSAPVPAAMRVYIDVPRDAEALIALKLQPEFRFPRATARIRAIVRSISGKEREVAREDVHPGLFAETLRTVRAPLRDFAGQVVQLRLQAEPVAGSTAIPRLGWAGVWLRGKMTPAAASVPGGESTPASQPPLVVIYLMDALRADHLQPYGYPTPSSPAIQKFAEDSVVFENAYASAAWTRTSVASIQTGVYPFVHRTRSLNDALPETLATIQGELQSRGYHTRGFVTNGNVSALFHFANHFEDYQYLPEKHDSKEIHVQSDVLWDRIRRSFESGIQLPAYLYIHATDTHAPYTPGNRFVIPLAGCSPDDPAMYAPGKRTRGSGAYTTDELKCMQSLYDGDIRKSDFYFGQFLEYLRKKGLYDQSLIILTADHGESFQEHSSLEHGKTLYQPEIRVPLIIHFPSAEHRGARIPTVARHVDIFPTIMSSLGYPTPREVQGRSLLPLLEGKGTDVPVYSEIVILRTDRSKGTLIEGDYKIIETARYARPNRYANDYELYNISNDPLEKSDLSSTQDVRLGYMRRLLHEMVAAGGSSTHRPEHVTIDPETEENLRALGYIDN